MPSDLRSEKHKNIFSYISMLTVPTHMFSIGYGQIQPCMIVLINSWLFQWGWIESIPRTSLTTEADLSREITVGPGSKYGFYFCPCSLIAESMVPSNKSTSQNNKVIRHLHYCTNSKLAQNWHFLGGDITLFSAHCLILWPSSPFWKPGSICIENYLLLHPKPPVCSSSPWSQT